MNIPLGPWASKETGKIAIVVKVDEQAIWYEIPEWNGWSSCAKHVFLDAMEVVTCLEQS